MRKPASYTICCLIFLCFTFLKANAQQVFKTTAASTIGYLEYVPADYNSNSNKYPIVIFLHGIGERGPNSTDPAVLSQYIQNVAKLGPPMYVKSGAQFPFILISPQLKNNYGDWPSDYVMEVINHVKTYLRIDERKIYLTGLSLGGGGTWWTAQDYPALFAAIAPVCGSRNNPALACDLASENLPVWAFHGDIDTTVPMSRSVNMVNAINGCTPAPNPLAKVTIYPNVAHSAWTNAYKNDNTIHTPNVYEWMMSYTNTKNNGNNIPIANAGSDKTVNIPGTGIIYGSATDSDGTIASYSWSQLSGPSTATLINGLTKTLTISALAAGTYVFRLTATDNSGNTDSDYVTVNVQVNLFPTANAGPDMGITLPINSVAIAGSGADPDGTIAAYGWAKTAGGSAALSGTTTPTLTASSLASGSYTFKLTVTDNKGASKSDYVTITVAAPNIPPVSNAGADKTIVLPTNSVIISGSGTDSDGTIASYGWTKISGGTATLTDDTTPNLTASGLTAGDYTFRLTVTDNKGAIAYDDVNVIVQAANILPVANAGSDKTIVLPTNSVVIAGSGSDADGTIASYLWTQVSGGTATLTSNTSSSLTASSLTTGNYTFRLTVTDNKGASAYDDADVIVQGTVANIVPLANAGVNLIVTLPTTTINIVGSGTDTDGSIVSYQWAKTKGNAVTLTNATTSTVIVNNLTEGAYYFRLTVTDNKGATDYDDMLLTVKAATTSAASVSGQSVSVLSESQMNDVSLADQLIASSRQTEVLGKMTNDQLANATVIIYNDGGEKIYSGNWTEETYKEVMNKKGLYIYNVMREGKRIDAGRIYIRD